MAANDVFIIGSPRCGTTWLQQLVGSHSRVATPQETHLAEYFGDWWRRWQAELDGVLTMSEDFNRTGQVTTRETGMPGILTEADLIEMLADLLDRIRRNAFAAKPGADVFVEKTPTTSLYVDLVDRVSPSCRFVHLIRDPRDAIASMQKAATTWRGSRAHGSFPTAIEPATRMYADHVQAALAARRHAERYMELRYEDMRIQPVEYLRRVLTFVGVDSTEDECRRTVALLKIETRHAGKADTVVVGGELAARSISFVDPPGFYGSGHVGDGRNAMSEYERWYVERTVGDLIGQFGYRAEFDAELHPFREVERLSRQLLGEAGRQLRKLGYARRSFRSVGEPRQ